MQWRSLSPVVLLGEPGVWYPPSAGNSQSPVAEAIVEATQVTRVQLLVSVASHVGIARTLHFSALITGV